MHADLVEGCRNGDSQAQLKLYQLYYDAMFNTAVRIVHDSAEAEDLMQEAFLDAFRKIDSFKGDSSFGAWLKRIVVNKSINKWQQRKWDFESLDGSKERIAEPEEQPADLQYKVEQVYEGIRQLPDGYRVILSLYLLEGYDHEEIGHVLGISASTSRSQYTRAKAKLKVWIQNQE